MNLLRFFLENSKGQWKPILITALISGLANGILLIVINTATNIPPLTEEHTRFFFLYATAMLCFIFAKRYALTNGITIAERVIKQLRLRVTEKIRLSELPHIENLNRGMVHTKLTQDINYISQTTIITIHACQEAIMVVFAMIYLSYLSKTVFVITIGGILLAVYFYYMHRRSTVDDLNALTAKESQLFNSLNHVLDGFKEIRMNRRRSAALSSQLHELADDTEVLKLRTGMHVVTDLMFSQTFFYTLIAAIVFILPQLMPSYGPILMKVTVAVLFIIAPLEVAVNSTPFFVRASVALNNIRSLEARLDETNGKGDKDLNVSSGEQSFEGFKQIQISSGAFSYYDPQGMPAFTVGPFDLTINKGEIVFFVGGNGSGKSTVLKLLTGLYQFESGTMMLDRVPIGRHNIDAYRDLFSVIFADFHLFDHLYGLEDVDRQRVLDLIHIMELDGKTDFKDGKFTDLNLSTGQRKRLALIVSMLENKDIYIFDEWAADQDAHFREYFYKDVLKKLQQENKTIIAVTHDDRYWDVADRVIHLDSGRLVESSGGPSAGKSGAKS